LGGIYNESNRADSFNTDRLSPSFIGRLKGAYVFDVGGNSGRDAEEYMAMGAEKSFIFEPIKAIHYNLLATFGKTSFGNASDDVVVLPYGLGKSKRSTRIGQKKTSGVGETDGEDAFEVGLTLLPTATQRSSKPFKSTTSYQT